MRVEEPERHMGGGEGLAGGVADGAVDLGMAWIISRCLAQREAYGQRECCQFGTLGWCIAPSLVQSPKGRWWQAVPALKKTDSRD